MSKIPSENSTRSHDPQALLGELLRMQEERDRLWAEIVLMREKMVLMGDSGQSTTLSSSSLPDRLAGLADELAGVARKMKAGLSGPVMDDEMRGLVTQLRQDLEEKKNELSIQSGELMQAREHNDALETQIRVLEISRRVDTGDSGQGDVVDFEPGDIGAQLVAALEREDQLLIRLHQMETTLSHRMADQLALLEKDKQIQQLKYFLHQGAQDFEKIQTRNRQLEGETLQHKHRIIELQSALERSQEQSRSALRRMQEQMTKQTGQLKNTEGFLREAEIRQENLEDEVERLHAHICQMEDKLANGAGQLELMRHEASRARQLEQEMDELGHEVERLEAENRLMLQERDTLSGFVDLLEENGSGLDLRVLEETRRAEELEVRLEELTSREQDLQDQMAELRAQVDVHSVNQEDLALVQARELELQGEIDTLRADFENRLLAASELLDEKQVFLTELEKKLAVALQERTSDREKLSRAETHTAELQQELDRLSVSHDAAGDRHDRELAMKDRQVQELESRCALLQVDVARLDTHLKESEAKNAEILQWSKQLQSELAQVQQMLNAEIEKRTGSEETVRQMEKQLPEIRRLFDVIEKQVDGFEDNLALEEERTSRLSENIDNLAGNIDVLFTRICGQLERLESERLELKKNLQELEEENLLLRDSPMDVDPAEVSRQQAAIQDLNTQLGIMEGDLLTMQVKMQNRIQPALENISRISGDLEILGMLNAAEELKQTVENLSALIRIDK